MLFCRAPQGVFLEALPTKEEHHTKRGMKKITLTASSPHKTLQKKRAEENYLDPFQSTKMFNNGKGISHDLTRMVIIRQAIDDRYAAVLC